MLEEGDDLLDRLFHAEELAEGRVAPDDAVAEDPGEARVVAGVDLFRFADAREHPFRGGRVRSRFALAQLEVVLEAHFLVLRGRIIRPEVVEQRRHRRIPIRPVTKMPDVRAVPSAPGIRSGTASWSCCNHLPKGSLRRPQKRRGHGGRIGFGSTHLDRGFGRIPEDYSKFVLHNPCQTRGPARTRRSSEGRRAMAPPPVTHVAGSVCPAPATSARVENGAMGCRFT